MPAETNEGLQEDLSAEQLEHLKVHFVKTIDEALAVSLPSVEQSAAAQSSIPPAPPPRIRSRIASRRSQSKSRRRCMIESYQA